MTAVECPICHVRFYSQPELEWHGRNDHRQHHDSHPHSAASDRTSNRRIVVGIDGSAESEQALHWAAAEAAASRAVLAVCHVTSLNAAVDPRILPVHEDLRRYSKELLDQAVTQATARWPELTVRRIPAIGLVAPELIAQAADGSLLVVGSRGAGAFRGLLVGSVSTQVAVHATVPVVVVHDCPADAPAAVPVVVGVDRSRSEDALSFGFDYAGRHGHPVLAVHAYQVPAPDPWAGFSGATVPTAYHRRALRMLDEAVQPWQDKYPRVPVDRAAVRAHPAATLITRSRGSALLVVGSRGHGGFTGLLLGSVTQHVLGHTTCPVAVVHH